MDQVNVKRIIMERSIVERVERPGRRSWRMRRDIDDTHHDAMQHVDPL